MKSKGKVGRRATPQLDFGLPSQPVGVIPRTNLHCPDYPDPAGKTSIPWYPAVRFPAPRRWLPVQFRRGRATGCQEGATPSSLGLPCGGCTPLCGCGPCWLEHPRRPSSSLPLLFLCFRSSRDGIYRTPVSSRNTYPPPFGMRATMKPCGGWCISRRSEGQMPMAEEGPAKTRPRSKRSGASYDHDGTGSSRGPRRLADDPLCANRTGRPPPGPAGEASLRR